MKKESETKTLDSSSSLVSGCMIEVTKVSVCFHESWVCFQLQNPPHFPSKGKIDVIQIKSKLKVDQSIFSKYYLIYNRLYSAGTFTNEFQSTYLLICTFHFSFFIHPSILLIPADTREKLVYISRSHWELL